jgi:hypothetical protein
MVMLSGCATTYQLVSPQQGNLVKHFQIACALLEEPACTTMEPPSILFTNTNPALGYYQFGTRVVMVTRECLSSVADQGFCSSIVVHEMIHYILYFSGKFQDDPCGSEAVAWTLVNAWVREIGRPDLADDNWRLMYPRCPKNENDS